jgi:hypothetical protein
MLSAFPGFLETTLDPPLTEQVVNEAILNRCNYVRRRRRFAGAFGLPAGRYYTLSHDERGDDGGTLLRELAAYADPVKGGVIFDAVDGIRGIGFRGQQVDPEAAITLRMTVPIEACRRHNPQILQAWLDFFEQPIPSANVSLLVTLPYSVEYQEISDVLDLRDIAAQDWLVNSFAIPEHDFLVKQDRASISSFLQMLPALVALDMGGNGITDSVGAYLRWMRAGGLVYPSARSDCFVSYNELKLEDFIGWNFVDYRDAGLSQPQLVTDMSSGWDAPVPATTSVETISDGPHRRSWKLSGTSQFTRQELHNKANAFLSD